MEFLSQSQAMQLLLKVPPPLPCLRQISFFHRFTDLFVKLAMAKPSFAQRGNHAISQTGGWSDHQIKGPLLIMHLCLLCKRNKSDIVLGAIFIAQDFFGGYFLTDDPYRVDRLVSKWWK